MTEIIKKKKEKIFLAILISSGGGLVILELFFRFFLFAWPPIYQHYFDDRNKQYLYMVGESTSQGAPYDPLINPAKLVSYQFHDSLHGRPIEIIQLAMSGKAIDYHYFTLFSTLLLRPHKNGLILLYSGINDDFPNEPKNIDFAFWRIFQHSIVLSKLYYMFGDNDGSPQKYEYRYHQLIQLAKSHHYNIVTSQLVGNIRGYDPKVEANDDLLKPANKRILHLAKHELDRGNFKTADSIFIFLQTRFQNENPYLTHYRGICKYEMANYDSASLLLNHTCEISEFTGFAHWKNTIIQRVSKAENIPMAKTYERFADSSEHHIPGFDLINDAHHPNLKGYCIMADEYSQCVSGLYGEKIKQCLTPEIIAIHFKFDQKYYQGVYSHLIEWYIYESMATKEREDRLGRLNFYLNKYKQLNPSDNTIILWEIIISVLEKNNSLFIKNLHSLDTLTIKDKNELLQRLEIAFQDKPDGYEDLRTTISKWQVDYETDIKAMNEVLSRLP